MRIPLPGSGINPKPQDRQQVTAGPWLALFRRAADPVAEWARRVVVDARQRGAVPRYGTPAWCGLAPTDPRRLAAVVVAAEAWRTSSPAHLWGRALLAEETAVLVGAQAVADDAAARVPLTAAVQAARELGAHLRRVDRARAAGSDVGLPLEERRRLALTHRAGDRVGPVDDAHRRACLASHTPHSAQEVA